MDTGKLEEDLARNLQPVDFKPNEEFLKILLEMGISREIAERALKETNNSSIELAAARALEMFDNVGDSDSWHEEEEFKMSFVVNDSLNMSPGKLAAQVAHGAVSLYRTLLEDPYNMVELTSWIENGETKVVLKGADRSALESVAREADDLRLTNVLIRDAGRTEVPPNSVTVLAIFGRVDKVNRITKKLRLL